LRAGGLTPNWAEFSGSPERGAGRASLEWTAVCLRASLPSGTKVYNLRRSILAEVLHSLVSGVDPSDPCIRELCNWALGHRCGENLPPAALHSPSLPYERVSTYELRNEGRPSVISADRRKRFFRPQNLNGSSLWSDVAVGRNHDCLASTDDYGAP